MEITCKCIFLGTKWALIIIFKELWEKQILVHPAMRHAHDNMPLLVLAEAPPLRNFLLSSLLIPRFLLYMIFNFVNY